MPAPIDYAPPRRRRRESGLPVPVRVAVALLPILVLAYLLYPTLTTRPAHTPEQYCQSNLRQIYQASVLYTNASRGPYPPSLHAAFSTQDLDPRVMMCPGVIRTVDPTTLPADVDAVSDYIYLGAGLWHGVEDHPGILLAYDKPSSHALRVVAIFSDGQLQQIALADLPTALARSAAARAKWEAATRPATRP